MKHEKMPEVIFLTAEERKRLSEKVKQSTLSEKDKAFLEQTIRDNKKIFNYLKNGKGSWK